MKTTKQFGNRTLEVVDGTSPRGLKRTSRRAFGVALSALTVASEGSGFDHDHEREQLGECLWKLTGGHAERRMVQSKLESAEWVEVSYLALPTRAVQVKITFPPVAGSVTFAVTEEGKAVSMGIGS